MKLGSLFDGIGTWCLSATKAGVEPVWASEIEQFPMDVAKSHFPNVKQLGDITKINGAEVEPVDIICAGSPCFVAGTMVITNRGIIPIEEVSIGDYVLTHTNSWQMVCETMKHGSDDVYEIHVEGTTRIKATGNHPIFVRHCERVWNNEKRSYDRRLSEPAWVEVKDLSKHDYIGYPINEYEYNPLGWTKEECWLIGRYIADGYVNNTQRSEGQFNHKIIFCIGEGKEKEFEEHLTTYNGCCKRDRTVFKYEIINERLMNFCKMCGCGAENKKLPPLVQNLPKELLAELLEGYISGDGCYIENTKTYSMSTVSRELAYGIQMAVHKAFGVACSVHFVKTPDTCVIEGRTVNQKDYYQIKFKSYIPKQSHVIVEDGIIWRPFRNKEKLDGRYVVYNLEVLNDHSYTANGIIVHNCQDLSVAGKQAGLAGERSGLFMDAMRICREMKEATNGEYPKFFVWENVPGAFSSNNRQDFRAVLEEIAETSIPMPKSGRWANAGMVRSKRCDIAWRILDAQYWGVPQRRKRIFLVADFRESSRRAGEILFVEQGNNGDFTQGK